MALAHRLWFASVATLSLVFMMAMPPFQTNDETSHWRRLWSAACGQLVCGHPIPELATDTIHAANYFGVRDNHEKFQLARWDAMRALPGTTRKENAGGNACVYVPIAYVLPALAMRPFINPFDPREPAGAWAAFYASRAANWLLAAVAVLLFVVAVPELRNVTLTLYSLPTLMQQTVVVNQEATTLALVLLLLYLWRGRPRLSTVLVALLAVTALASMKAVFLVLLLFWLALVLRWRRNAAAPTATMLGVLALGAVPIVIQALWSHFVVRVSGKEFLPGWGVDPDAQMHDILHRPLHLVGVLWRAHGELFGQEPMRGGWTSVLGVLGWADLEIGMAAYVALLLAIVLAVVADLMRAPNAGDESRWLRHALPLLSSYAIVPAVMTAMYLVFTNVGADRPLGVQGRYLVFPYFLMLAIAMDWARRTRLHPRLAALPEFLRAMLPWLCAALCLFADRAALRAVFARFY
jgi:uncharacterized membrane protein